MSERSVTLKGGPRNGETFSLSQAGARWFEFPTEHVHVPTHDHPLTYVSHLYDLEGKYLGTECPTCTMALTVPPLKFYKVGASELRYRTVWVQANSYAEAKELAWGAGDDEDWVVRSIVETEETPPVGAAIYSPTGVWRKAVYE